MVAMRGKSGQYSAGSREGENLGRSTAGHAAEWRPIEAQGSVLVLPVAGFQQDERGAGVDGVPGRDVDGADGGVDR